MLRRSGEQVITVTGPGDAPLSLTYASLLQLIGPCGCIDPVNYRPFTERYVVRTTRGLTGRVYLGVGNSVEVVDGSRFFEFTYDSDAPRSFIRSSVSRALAVAKKYKSALVLLAYVPVGVVLPIKHSNCRPLMSAGYLPVPPPSTVDSCAPRRRGESLLCTSGESEQEHGVLAVAVSSNFLYVVAGFGLTLVSRVIERVEQPEHWESEAVQPGSG
ncbi:MAG: hypothetical protein QXN29_04240 [Thermofilaceae archaeon]